MLGRASWSWAELRRPGAWAGSRILAALVQAGRVDTGPPGRPEAGWVLHLSDGGTAEPYWSPLLCEWSLLPPL